MYITFLPYSLGSHEIVTDFELSRCPNKAKFYMAFASYISVQRGKWRNNFLLHF